MKIISWNVNGIRAILKKGFMDWVNEANADVICQKLKSIGGACIVMRNR